MKVVKYSVYLSALPQIILPATQSEFSSPLKTDVINTGILVNKYIYIMIAVMVASFSLQKCCAM